MRIAVCDDNEVCREMITEYIHLFNEEFSEEASLFEFCRGDDLVDAYNNGERFDLIFLEAEMSALSGISAGYSIRKSDNDVMLIFLSNNLKFISDAFILNAFQFLFKPLAKDVFCKELTRAISTYRKKIFKYRIEYKDNVSYLEIKNIFYIETFNRHLRVATVDQFYEYRGRMSHEEKVLLPHNFMRCHQGYLVNMSHIKNINRNTVLLKNGKEIPISKHLKSRVMESFNAFISGCCI